MTPNILEEKIKGLSADYIYYEAIGSLFLLLMSIAEDENNETTFHYSIHEDIQKIKTAVRHYTAEIKDILNGDKETRQTSLENCLCLKNSLLSIYENIYGYFSLWNIYSTAISNEVALRKYKKENVSQKEVSWEMFYMDCFEFLNTAKYESDQKKLMGQLLKCIPMKITREKYLDLIEQSLHLAFADESEEFIESSLRAFEGFCAPESTTSYGKYFPEIAQWLKNKKNLQTAELSDEELEELYSDFDSIFNSLTQIEEMFSGVLNDIHSLIILFYLNYTFDDLIGDNVAYNDLYQAVCDIITGEYTEVEKTAYLDTLTNSLETEVEPIIDKANEIGKQELELMKKVTSFEQFSEDTKKVLLTEDFIRSCYYGDLNESLFQIHSDENQPPADTEFKNNLFKKFIAHISDFLQQLPQQTKRIAMQILFSALPPTFSVEELMDIIKHAVESASTPEQKVLLLDKVGMIFQENGFDTLAAEHSHSHSCNCGHHHEHSHSHHQGCGCEHDHHHI